MIRGMIDGFIDATGNIALVVGFVWGCDKISQRFAKKSLDGDQGSR